MSYPVNVTVQVKGGPVLADFSNLSVSQFMFTHHAFSLDFSFEALGRALGLQPAAVCMGAHEQLIGKGVTIAWESSRSDGPKGTFQFSGVVLETSVHTDTDLVSHYHISGHSATYLLEDGVQHRTFRQQSVQDIFQQVLAPYPADVFQQQLRAQHPAKLPYVVQYQESNYQFLARLAARHNEWLYYDGQALHLGASPRGAPLRFQAGGNQTFALAMRLQPTGLQGAAYSYRTHAPFRATAAAPAGGHAYSRFAARRSAAVFTQPHRLRGDAPLADRAQLQGALDASAARSAEALVTLEGRGECFTLTPGTLLDVYDAAQASYGQFRVLAVRHTVAGGRHYTNHFEAQPGAGAVPPPHPLAAAPTAQPELAQVIDGADPRRLGRVRVRFQWDVAQPLDAESGWLRVSTPYSGDGKGHLFTPEVGSQVLVGYEHGLAEFPVVLGNLFHPHNPQGAQYTTPDNHLKGLQTAGGNKVVMSDKQGAQTILLSNSNNKGTAVEVGFQGDGSITIKSNGPVTVLSPTITLEAGEKGTIKLHAKTIALDADEEFTLSSKLKSITMKAKQNILADAEDKMALTAKTASLTGRESAGVLSPDTVDVGKGATVNVSARVINQD